MVELKLNINFQYFSDFKREQTRKRSQTKGRKNQTETEV